MRAFLPALALSIAALGIAPAVAQTDAAAEASIRTGLTLVSTDGTRVGKIERIVTNASGSPVSAAVIYNSRFVYVPVDTITAADRGRATTSLTRADLRKLP